MVHSLSSRGIALNQEGETHQLLLQPPLLNSRHRMLPLVFMLITACQNLTCPSELLITQRDGHADRVCVDCAPLSLGTQGREAIFQGQWAVWLCLGSRGWKQPACEQIKCLPVPPGCKVLTALVPEFSFILQIERSFQKFRLNQATIWLHTSTSNNLPKRNENSSKGSPVGKQISIMQCVYLMEYYTAVEVWTYWYKLQHGSTSKILCKVKDTRHKDRLLYNFNYVKVSEKANLYVYKDLKKAYCLPKFWGGTEDRESLESDRNALKLNCDDCCTTL